jgi:isocitrate dehydrogenase (NAD+)
VSIPVTLVRGDTLHGAVVEQLQPLLGHAGADLDLRMFDSNDGAVTPELIEAIQETGVALIGFQWGRREDGELPPIVQLRRALGITANLRPIRSLPGVDCVVDDLDLWVVREVTEDVYAHLEHQTLPGVFESLKVTTREACERISRTAFEFARRHGRKKVTTVHKSNIMKLSDGMFLRVSAEVAKEYPDIEHDEVIVDACCMKLVIWPQQFDVLLCGNLFGDIVGDLGAGLTGGAVNTPSINLGDDIALFTIGQRGPETGEADPLPLLISTLHLLEHLELYEPRKRLGAAAERAVLDGVRPRMLGGAATVTEYFDAVRARL